MALVGSVAIVAALAITNLQKWYIAESAEATPPVVSSVLPPPKVLLPEGTHHTAGAVEDLAFSPDDGQLAWLTSSLNELHVWRLRDGLHRQASIADRPNSLAWSADSRTLAV